MEMTARQDASHTITRAALRTAAGIHVLRPLVALQVEGERVIEGFRSLPAPPIRPPRPRAPSAGPVGTGVRGGEPRARLGLDALGRTRAEDLVLTAG